ncbi:M10 family metallopeptidase C-terminal domain-containing protein [Rhizobium sp. ARZ01]|uniref:calcium-binding protein n=1 Tax=Rhizobium sp. ARZ01 TaxID=2769313 RepID=UPI00177B7512|nr:M10 family metallopeptidase C-terminal domain-containing protein [Rhizobium sp. ARZ01]MBD9371609.1 M10 family metallopeptidase C-terminal domain-containing protein [Rhizobium sp. ARZ01]
MGWVSAYKYIGNNYANTVSQGTVPEVDIFTYGGNDKIYLNLVSRDGGFNYVEAGSGNDYVKNWFEGGNKIYLGSGNDTYIHNGYAIDDDYRDYVYGESGNDWFEVLTLQSRYYGGDDNDTFLSAGFRNYFSGGSGVDTLSYELQDDSKLKGRGVLVDLDQKYAKVGSNKETFSSIENAIGTSYNDTLRGTNGANDLEGGSGNDILSGFGGNDYLLGGYGSDKLLGGSGNDDLVGGRGYDILNGGTGSDYFIFDSIKDSAVGKYRDVIQDFYSSEKDKIDLSNIDANINRSGNQAFTFISNKAFSDKAGELRYSGHIIQGDVDGDGYADFEIYANYTKYYSSDFIL